MSLPRASVIRDSDRKLIIVLQPSEPADGLQGAKIHIELHQGATLDQAFKLAIAIDTAAARFSIGP